MLVRQNRLPRRTATDVLISSIIVLVGVLSISYGYHQHSKIMLYIGLIITLAGVLIGLLFVLISRETSGKTASGSRKEMR
jgi:hypothetical protein